jgi:catechol 2,3-dioxygenase-like lactoylglutathione lyase family enzyme
MLDHITLAVADFQASRAFYDHVLAPLGIAVLYEDDQSAGYGRDGKASFWIARRDPPSAQVHVAFAAPDQDAVAAFHAAALAHGGRDNGGPGPRPQYHDRYFAAFAFDPDGNNIEAVIQ